MMHSVARFLQDSCKILQDNRPQSTRVITVSNSSLKTLICLIGVNSPLSGNKLVLSTSVIAYTVSIYATAATAAVETSTES